VLPVSTALLFAACAMPSIVIHEMLHAYAAYRLGDPTAKAAGRLTLNPIKHVDPIGTVAVPLLFAVFTGGRAMFGWAKPVPMDPRRFRDYRQGMLVTGLAGPAGNLALAAVTGLVILTLGGIPSSVDVNGSLMVLSGPAAVVIDVLYWFYQVNLILLFINLIPIPPLDGSRVLPVFLSDEAMVTYARVEQYGLWIILGLVFVLPFLGFNVIDWYFRATVDPLLALVHSVR